MAIKSFCWFVFLWLFLLMNWNLEREPLWSVSIVVEVYFQVFFVLFLPDFPHFSPLPYC